MSLKAFHIFFIAVSTLFSFGFGVWALSEHFAASNVPYLLMGLLAFVIGIALVFYGVNFLHKFKHERLL